MIPAWPQDLPKPLRQGYSAQRDDPRQAKPADTGPPGYRRRFSKAAETVALQIEATRDERAVFDRFHRDRTASGVLPFTMPDPTTDGWALLASDGQPLLTPDGTPLLLSERWLCLFGPETPGVSITANRFVISFSVSVMP